MTENELAKQIVDAAYRMHTSLGPRQDATKACPNIQLIQLSARTRYFSSV